MEQNRETINRPTHYSNWFLSKVQRGDFPGDAVIKNLPASAGDTRLIPGLRRSHMPWNNWAREPQLLRLCSRAHEPQLLKPTRLEPVLHNKRSYCSEKPTHCNEKSVHCNEDPTQPKIKINRINKSIKKKKEKWLNSHESSKLCGVLTCPCTILHCPSQQ